MSVFFDKFSGGIFTVIKVKEICTFYYGENSWWLIDDWENDILNDTYFEIIKQLKIEYEELKNAYREDCFNFNNSLFFSWLPSLYIDFDNKVLFNNFYDQAIEDRLAEGWKGTFVEDKNVFLTLIPVEYNYWLDKSVENLRTPNSFF